MKAPSTKVRFAEASKLLDYGFSKFSFKNFGNKNFWILLLLLLSGIVLGGFIGSLASSVPFLSWLNFGQSFGLNDPLVLDLGVLIITFGLSIKITLASLIGVVLALIVYRFI